MSVMEVVAGVGADGYLPSTVFNDSSFLSVLKTWDVTTTCGKETQKALLEEQGSPIAILDFTQGDTSDTPPKTYDLVVVSDISSYEPNLEQVIEHMCKVVEGGGTACILASGSILERTQHALEANHMEPTVLQNSEEAGAISAVSQEPSLIISKKPPGACKNATMNGVNGEDNLKHNVVLIQAADPTKAALEVASNLTQSLERHGYTTENFSWTSASDMISVAGKLVISLPEFQQPFLQDVDESDFKNLKKLLLETGKLFWVTALDDPSTAMIDGLTRTVRSEMPGLSLRVFHADGKPTASPTSAASLVDMMVKAFLWTGEDNEFHVKEGLLHVSRIEEDPVLNEEINGLLPGAAKAICSLPLKEVPCPVKLCVLSPGMLSSICLERDDTVEATLEPDYIEINVKATALKYVSNSPQCLHQGTPADKTASESR